MTTVGNFPTDWQSLYLWYLDAGELVRELDQCCLIVRSMLVGSVQDNLGATQILNVLTLDAEVWLATHPCPEPWNGRWLADAVAAFVAIGRLSAQLGSDSDGLRLGHLGERIDVACAIVQQVKDLVDRLRPTQPN